MTKYPNSLKNRVRGGAGAAEYGLFANGSTSAQMGQLNSSAMGNASQNSNLLHHNNPGQGWKGGRRRRKGKMSRRNGSMGGTGLVEMAVPAALMYANHVYRPRNASVAFRRSRSGTRFTRRRRHGSRKH